VLGKNGMLGNAVFSFLKQETSLNCYGTAKKNEKDSMVYEFTVDKDSINNLNYLFEKIKPDFVVNCIGKIRPINDNLSDYYEAIFVNSYFPKILAGICTLRKIRLIQISTDCVFDGKKGNYCVNEIPNEVNIYGLTKFIGEIYSSPHVTIRTSIIGIEKNSSRNLLGWFLNVPEKKIQGYSNVFWNGVTTLTLAKIIRKIIVQDLNFANLLIQIAGEKISKYDLLHIFKIIFRKEVEITKNDQIRSDKTLLPSPEQDKHFKELIVPIKKQIAELKDFYNM